MTMSEHGDTAQNTIPLVSEEQNDAPGCAGSSRAIRDQAAGQANQETLDQYAKDYPVGPHDQPQSMCPAFGSLRVGLRMRRTATVLSGSACCVYGLTFTSHFYGARRTVGYVPFDSETLVTGKLFEDIRESVHTLADPDKYDAVVVINLCVPTASGVPLDLLPKAINGVRVIGIDVPGFGVPTHAEAKDVLAAAMLKYARNEVAAGPVARPSGKADDNKPSVALLGEIFPVDAIIVDKLLAPLGASAGPVVPTREWRELYAALNSNLVAMLHPFYSACNREFEAAGKPVIGSAPVGAEGTADWLQNVGTALGAPADVITRHSDAMRKAITAAIAANPINARITLSGYEGSELLVGRLLVESGADLRYVGSACPATRWNAHDRDWLEAHGVTVKFRASLEDDLCAVDAFEPELAVGTTPVVQHAKQRGTPALYFTNLISARPLMGPAGAGSLSQVINTAVNNKARFDAMDTFFEGVGKGDAAGVWTEETASRAGLVNAREVA